MCDEAAVYRGEDLILEAQVLEILAVMTHMAV
jgi:hypothetical protein